MKSELTEFLRDFAAQGKVSEVTENKLVFLVKNACRVPLIVKHFLRHRLGQENNEASFKHYHVDTVNSSVKLCSKLTNLV